MRIKSLLLSAAVGLASMAALSSGASAAVVCNRFGDCWHTTVRYHYRPSFGLIIHDDHYRLHRGLHWREHGGRGYWRNGVWIRF